MQQSAAKENRSLGKILDSMEDTTRMLPDRPGQMADEEFVNVFLLAEKKGEKDRLELKAKIDASYFKIEEWEAEAASWGGRVEYFQELANEYKKKEQALANKAKGHREYMAFRMREHGLEELQGNHHSVLVERISNPKTVIAKSRLTAKAADARDFPGFVSVTPRQYDWDLNAIKAELKKIEKKKPADLTDADKKLLEVASLKWSYKVKFGPAGARPKGDEE